MSQCVNVFVEIYGIKKKKNCNFAYCAVIAPERRYVNINTYTYKVLKQHVGPILEYDKKFDIQKCQLELIFSCHNQFNLCIILHIFHVYVTLSYSFKKFINRFMYKLLIVML